MESNNNFIEREREFRRENDKLEMKTRQLLQKVDSVMNKLQENIEPVKITKEIPTNRCKDINPTELNLPKTVDGIGTKGMIRFYKSKIKAVQDDMEKLQLQFKNKSDELKKLQINLQTMTDEKEKWFLQYNLEKNKTTNLEKQISECNRRLQLQESENSNLKKETELLKHDLKTTASDLSSSNGKLKRASLEIEKVKSMLHILKQEDKANKEAYKTTTKDLTTTIKKIQKHKNELLTGYKKQLQLIDNLKKQKAHIESCKVMELAEGEFFKLLDWKLD